MEFVEFQALSQSTHFQFRGRLDNDVLDILRYVQYQSLTFDQFQKSVDEDERRLDIKEKSF